MGILLFFIVTFFIFLFIIVVNFKTGDIDVGGGFFLIELINTLVLFFLIYDAATADIRWEEFKAEYEATKAIVETYHPYDYGNTVDITKKMMEINSTIARNKARSKSKLYNIWYSEEVGNLEPLKFSVDEKQLNIN